MMERLDIWWGKRVFVPLVARLHWWTGASKEKIASYSELAAWLGLLYAIMPKMVERIQDGSLVAVVGLGLILAVTALITLAHLMWAGLMPDRFMFVFTGSRRFYLAFWLFFDLPLSTLGVVVGHWPDTSDPFWPLIILAAYARAIDRLPPKKTKAKKPAKTGRLVTAPVNNINMKENPDHA